MIPPFLYPYLITALVAVFVSGLGTWKIMSWRCDAQRVEAVERTIKQMEQQQAQNDEIASRFEAERVRTVTLYRQLEDTINENNPPYLADCKFPAAWLWAWNTANRGVEAGPKPANDPVPEVLGTTNRGDTPRLVPESYSISPAVPRLQSEGGRLDRMGGWFE